MEARSSFDTDFARCPLVFVYGTLRRGGSNAFRMEGCEFVAEASMPGRLYRISWYPGLIPDAGAGAGAVSGELFRLDAAERLPALDEYEGEEYRRELGDFEAGGERVEAWFYHFTAPLPEGAMLLEDGEWPLG